MLRGSWALLLVCATGLFGASTALPANSIANAVQVDAAGNLYLAGFFFASSSAANPPAHAFVAKLSPDASQTLWWTQLAGSKDDRAQALALGPGNSVYVTGKTQSPDFPTSPGAFATTGHAFVAKLDAGGVIVYSTYLPATSGQAIAVDAAGYAFVTGPLLAGDALKTTTGAVAGARQSAFIIELDPAGAKAVLSIVGFGGTQIALDSAGNIYAAGAFSDPSVPTTPGAFQPSVGVRTCSSSQVFAGPCVHQHIAKIDSTGTRLLYATYLSGTLGATPTGIAIDRAGNAILAGTTNSPDYPTTPGAYQPEYSGTPSPQLQLFSLSPPASVGFVTKLNATGSGLVWSTLFGGSGGQIPASFIVGDSIAGMAVDPNGNILIAGAANSPDLPGLWNTPVSVRPVAINGASPVGFVARLTPDGASLSPVQLLNNLQRDLAEPTGGAVAVRTDGSAIVVGKQISTSTFAPLGRVAAICDAADDAKIVRVAPGQLITLYGSNLDSATVTFNALKAPILYTSTTQINLQVPYEIAGQSELTMQVTGPAISESYLLGVAAQQPAVFLNPADFTTPLADAVSCQSQTLAGLQPLALNADGSINSCANPAAPGSTVTVFLNGMGVTTPPQLTGAINASNVALAPSAQLVPSNAPSSLLPTFTLAGAISGVAQVQLQAGTASFVATLKAGSASVRGPGIVIWVQPALIAPR
jgi:uncharacterized protein (TIGR03437 family)